MSIKSVLLIVTIKALDVIKKREDFFNKVIKETLVTMDDKEQVMRWLDAGMTNLGLLINIGNSVAAVSPFLITHMVL